MGAEPRAEVGEGPLGIAFVGGEHEPRLNLEQPRGGSEPLMPRLEVLADLVVLLAVEGVECVKVVEVLGAGDELLESG